ncbi:tryptophan--tRNA ligase [Wohlfahrtiimonas larvae]|uniref:Tryptophan--tRNA ligase n=1 Tax=Wohlfahrtiimonas larvae TaxID=1157986 RepID=A0ABP9MYN2_9GAMM|nr:tryptophan--tRNA ligase [Wohlfahrtiimonas larvae]
MSKQVILTGITTTGTPHLGNFAGAVGPAIAMSKEHDNCFFFLADYHALIKCQEPARIIQSRQEIAATWLALGLDTDKATFYRQSDIPEITQLMWLLTCVTAKGLMNRAHAYKAAVDDNTNNQEDPDKGITMGLFSYPVLMAADILMFNAHQVPVGRDQIQHVEMARDIAQRFNYLYGEHFVLPEAKIEKNVALLPGLDGRKMSKSYNNTIPLFLPEKQLRKSIMKIVTDSTEPGVPKDPDQSTLYEMYKAFATEAECAEIRKAYAEGIAWGEMKQVLFEKVNAILTEPREKYNELMANPEYVEGILLKGAERAREHTVPFIAQLQKAVGL